MNTYTSATLERLETESLESITEQCTIRYCLTDDERGWLQWIGDRYTVSEYLASVTDGDGVATIDVHSIGAALAADGVDRAPCLSEDTELARLIWFIGPSTCIHCDDIADGVDGKCAHHSINDLDFEIDQDVEPAVTGDNR